LKTFEDMNAKTSLKCKSGEILTGHINPEIVFRRALVLTNGRELSYRESTVNKVSALFVHLR
jgi:uncharacterized protein YifN (PemK superfamily)